MVATQDQKQLYLEDHLPYELGMLRYTHEKLANVRDQLDWNAYFESFCVHARNLYLFLAGGDPNNMKAAYFIPGFKKTPRTNNLFPRLLGQVFHLSPRRESEAAKKVALEDASAMRDWIEDGIRDFENELDADSRALWKHAQATYWTTSALFIGVKGLRPSATNHIDISTSGFSAEAGVGQAGPTGPSGPTTTSQGTVLSSSRK